MKAKILSLNIGGPAPMEWEGKSVLSSMKKESVTGPLVVHEDRIEGNSFANPNYHGTPDSVLYAFGMDSAEIFMKVLGGGEYKAGATGETLTLDQLDETRVSVGDIFQFGEVLAQATYPRIPCGKVNFRMQNAHGQQAMKDCGRSGVYFKILRPGKIHLGDAVMRTEEAKHRVSIFDLYEKIVKNEKFSGALAEAARANGCIPERILAKVT
jgi:MOSC domain-containing protein YiiM